MAFVDLLFPVQGSAVPLDHGYLLFSALSARLPQLHERKDVGIFHLRGSRAGQQLNLAGGTLRLRCSAEALPLLLPLTGSTLEVAGQPLRLGVPTVRALTLPTSLTARLVTFKHSMDEQTFHVAVVRSMAELGCSGTPYLSRRRIVTIAGSKVVGFALTVTGLSPESSLKLQEHGLGGRRHMGCGLFLPTRLRSPALQSVEQRPESQA